MTKILLSSIDKPVKSVESSTRWKVIFATKAEVPSEIEFENIYRKWDDDANSRSDFRLENRGRNQILYLAANNPRGKSPGAI